MKMTLNEILIRYSSIVKLSEKKLPIKLSYALLKNIFKLRNESEIIDNNRIKLAEIYAEKNDDGSPKTKDGNFIIENEDLLEQWPEFKKLYEKIAAVDIDKMFDLPLNKFKAALHNLPVGFKDSIKNIASAKILDGSLDSISKIKAMDEVFNTELQLLIE